MSNAPKRIMIVAGEASGDLHGAHLVQAMRERDPSLTFYGVGGKRLEEAGVELIAHATDMAVVGLTEVISKLGMILGVMRQLKASFKAHRPDLVILIDYPDFNLRMAKAAKITGLSAMSFHRFTKTKVIPAPKTKFLNRYYYNAEEMEKLKDLVNSMPHALGKGLISIRKAAKITGIKVS